VKAARVLLLAALALAPAVALLPLASADDDLASQTVYTAGSVVVCSMLGVDQLLVNTFTPWTGGDYPGRPTMQVVTGALQPGGAVGGPLTSVGQAGGAVFTTAYGDVLFVTQTGEDEAAAAGAFVGGQAIPGVGSAHDLKCFVTHNVVFATWDAFVKPQGDCVVQIGGPFQQWVFASIQPPPRVPGLPPCT
jgi:hypothetical protein